MSRAEGVTDGTDTLDNLHCALDKVAQLSVIAEIRARLTFEYSVSGVNVNRKVCGCRSNLAALSDDDTGNRFGEFLRTAKYQRSIRALRGLVQAVTVADDRGPRVCLDTQRTD